MTPPGGRAASGAAPSAVLCTSLLLLPLRTPLLALALSRMARQESVDAVGSSGASAASAAAALARVAAAATSAS